MKSCELFAATPSVLVLHVVLLHAVLVAAAAFVFVVGRSCPRQKATNDFVFEAHRMPASTGVALSVAPPSELRQMMLACRSRTSASQRSGGKSAKSAAHRFCCFFEQ